MPVLCEMHTIQYSARNARLSVHWLFTSCIRRGYCHVTQQSIVTGCLRLTAVSVICRAVNPCSTSQKIWRGGFLYGVYRRGMTLNWLQQWKLDIPWRDHLHGNEFPSIYNHSGVMTAWCRKMLIKNLFCVFWKKRPITDKYSKFCYESIHRHTDRHVVFKFREIWPTRNRQDRALLTWQGKKQNFTWLSSCCYSADCAQNLPGPA